MTNSCPKAFVIRKAQRCVVWKPAFFLDAPCIRCFPAQVMLPAAEISMFQTFSQDFFLSVYNLLVVITVITSMESDLRSSIWYFVNGFFTLWSSKQYPPLKSGSVIKKKVDVAWYLCSRFSIMSKVSKGSFFLLNMTIILSMNLDNALRGWQCFIIKLPIVSISFIGLYFWTASTSWVRQRAKSLSPKEVSFLNVELAL